LANPEHSFIKATIKQEPFVKNDTEALLDIYKRLRPGDLPNIDNAKTLVNTLFFNPRHYNLGKVGRYKLSKRLGKEFSCLETFMNIYEVENRSEILDLIIIIHRTYDEHYRQQQKMKESISKGKAKGRR